MVHTILLWEVFKNISILIDLAKFRFIILRQQFVGHKSSRLHEPRFTQQTNQLGRRHDRDYQKKMEMALWQSETRRLQYEPKAMFLTPGGGWKQHAKEHLQ